MITSYLIEENSDEVKYDTDYFVPCLKIYYSHSLCNVLVRMKDTLCFFLRNGLLYATDVAKCFEQEKPDSEGHQEA